MTPSMSQLLRCQPGAGALLVLAEKPSLGTVNIQVSLRSVAARLGDPASLVTQTAHREYRLLTVNAGIG